MKVRYKNAILEVRSVLNNADNYCVIKIIDGSCSEVYILKNECTPILEPKLTGQHESTQSISIPVNIYASGTLTEGS